MKIVNCSNCPLSYMPDIEPGNIEETIGGWICYECMSKMTMDELAHLMPALVSENARKRVLDFLEMR